MRKKTAGERLVLACSELPNAEEKSHRQLPGL